MYKDVVNVFRGAVAEKADPRAFLAFLPEHLPGEDLLFCRDPDEKFVFEWNRPLPHPM